MTEQKPMTPNELVQASIEAYVRGIPVDWKEVATRILTTANQYSALVEKQREELNGALEESHRKVIMAIEFLENINGDWSMEDVARLLDDLRTTSGGSNGRPDKQP